MDHILENEAKPVPDLSSVSEVRSIAAAAEGGDEDEDAEALRAILAKSNASSSDAAATDNSQEAKV